MSATEKIPPKSDTTVIVGEKTEEQQPGIREDIWKIVRLVFLYALLGVPIGLTGVIARLHKNGAVGHIDLIMLFAPWAVTWKLFWTPFLNCPIIHSLGRRISWVFAAYGQFIILVLLSLYADTRLIENGGASTYLVLLLALMFSLMYFLVAIQTIEVYRWAFTMLRPCNLRYNPICNSVGQNVGYYLVLAAWKSKDFCNKYLSSAFLEEEIITLPRFLFIFGLIFIVATYLVAFFKKDNVQESSTENELKTQDLWNLVQTSQVQKLAGVLLVYIIITPLTAVGSSSSNNTDEMFYMKTIVLASKRILMTMAKCLTGPGLVDISKTAIPYRFITCNTFFVVILALVFSNFSLTILNFVIVFGNHSFYMILIYCILRSICVPNEEENKASIIFVTTLLESADELYYFCLSSFISNTIKPMEISS